MAEVRKEVKADIAAVEKIYDDILTEEENGTIKGKDVTMMI